MIPGIDYIGVNCAFLCHDGQGRFLLHKRSSQCRDEHGRWDFGAGQMEFGETFEQTVRREVQEEYGAEPIQIQYISTRVLLRVHDGKSTHWIVNIHLVQVDPSQVRIMEPHKVDDIGWFPPDSLPEPLHSAVDEDLKAMI